VRRAAGRCQFVTNYRGLPVPLGLGWAWFTWGVALILVQLAAVLVPPVRAVAMPLILPATVMPVLLVPAVAVFGLLDDLFGRGDTRGFRGHLSAAAHGRVTTGAVKLVGIGVLALVSAWWMSRWGGVLHPVEWLAGAAVIALTANLVNLLDLRPGRALKAYVLLALPSAALLAWRLAWGGHWASAILLALVLGPALATFPPDLAERGMLGDMGANAAGALAGWLLAFALRPWPVALVAVAAALLALNLASERVSFSAVIEGNRVLRWFDSLGRTAGGERDGPDTTGETGR
jgi:hypothetical protein